MYRDLGYARISKDDERRGKGVARQKADVRRHSTATGGQLVTVADHQGAMVDVLTDNDLSASKYARKKRKDFPLVLDYAQAGLCDRIIIYRMDRLLRIPSELEDLIKLCETRNVLVVNLNGTMDLTTAEGIKHARDRVADAAFESDLISERTRRSFDETAAEGAPHGATGKARSFGFEPDGITLRVPEAEAIRTAAADVLFAGAALNEIARRWNAQGFRGPRSGNPWSNRTVRAVLVGRRAAGLRVHREGVKDRDGNLIEQTYPAKWPAIIDEATHRALRRRYVDHPARRPSKRTPYSGLLWGIVDGDERPMRRDRSANSGGIYTTTARHVGERFTRVAIGPVLEVEEAVRELLFVRVESGALAEAIAKRRAAQGAERAAESVATVQALIDQADEDEADGTIDRRGWLTKRRRLVGRLRAAELVEATAGPSVLDTIPVDIRAQWPGWDVDRQGTVLREVLERVEVSPAVRRGPGLDLSRIHPVWR